MKQKMIFLLVTLCSFLPAYSTGFRIGEVGNYNVLTGYDLLTDNRKMKVDIPLEVKDWKGHSFLQVTVTAEDNNGLIVPDFHYAFRFDHLDRQDFSVSLPVEVRVGFYRIKLLVETSEGNDMLFTDLSVLPPQASGSRPNSFFSSNTSHLKVGKELQFFQDLGFKVQRCHFLPNGPVAPAKVQKQGLDLDFTSLDLAFAENKEKGVWALPILGYCFGGAESAASKKFKQHGPPRDFDEFANSVVRIMQHYPEIEVWELWNEPWIYEWTWAASPAEWRAFQKTVLQAVKKKVPQAKLVVGNSTMFVADHIEPYSDCWKGIFGITHHPYANAEGRSLRHNAQVPSIYWGYELKERMGVPRYYDTEGGTWFYTPKEFLQALEDKTKFQKKLINEDGGIPVLNCWEKKNAAYQRLLNANLANTEVAALQAEIKRLDKVLQGYRQKNLGLSELIGALDRAQYILDKHPAFSEHENNNNVNATKNVQYNVTEALAGAFQGNMQWGIGYGPEWTRSNQSIGILHYLTEDRPAVAYVWPCNDLLTGAIFASPKYVTPEVENLPLGSHLRDRLKVEMPAGKYDDPTKVAVLFTNTGETADCRDDKGQMIIPYSRNIRAFDLMGREIPPVDGQLVLTLSEYPVYVVTENLSVVDFQQLLSNADIRNITALNFYAQSLLKPANQAQKLIVTVNNQWNKPLSGNLTLMCNQNTVTVPFSIGTGGVGEVEIPWTPVDARTGNQYPVHLTAETNCGNYEKNQLVAFAGFSKRTIRIDGRLNDWEGVIPVELSSDRIASGVDLTQYILNPMLSKDELLQQKTADRVAMRLYTAYDDAYMYVAAKVYEKALRNDAGMLAKINGVESSFVSGDPHGGLRHPAYLGDALLLAFGFRDRVPGMGEQIGNPLAWKGQFFDTDYQYIAHISKNGDKLIRQWGADTPRRSGYQVNKESFVSSVSGAKIKIYRDEAQAESVYEIAIPRSELKLFDSDANKMRFTFTLINDEKAGVNGKMQWAEAAGVFDYWLNYGTFGPLWDVALPCQTYFGIEQ